MMNIAEIIRLSWDTYTSKFKNYVMLIGLIFLFSAIGSIASFCLTEVLNTSQLVGMISSAIISTIVYLLTFAVTILLVLYTERFLNNKKAKFGIKDILQVFWPALWISVLAGLITVGGFVLLIVPGVIFTVWYAFSMYIAILEKKKGLALLSESRELSRGKFWPVFGRLALPNIFWSIIAYLVLAGIFNLIGLILDRSVIEQTELSLLTNIALIAVSSLVGAFFAPLYIIVMTIVYKEVRK